MRVAMTAYRRPDYLENTLAAWLSVRGLTDLHVSIDYSDTQMIMADVVHRSAQLNHSVNVYLTLRPKHLGVLEHPYQLLCEEFADHDFAVLAEEDVLPSVDTLEYMAWCRDYLADTKIMAACAHSRFVGSVPVDGRKTIHTARTFDPLIWGTWRDKWATWLQPTWDHDYSSGDEGHEAGWDWNIRKRVLAVSGHQCAFPLTSRSLHIGQHDGVHTDPMQPADEAPTYAWDHGQQEDLWLFQPEAPYVSQEV